MSTPPQASFTPKRNVTGALLFAFILVILGDVLGAGVSALVGPTAGEVGGITWPPLAIISGVPLLTQQSGDVWLRGGLLVTAGVLIYVALRTARGSRKPTAGVQE
ncbi:hypothetical protein [Pseudoclavibacter sp. Z016]|uniref:hypothetical protein n=1 Tax=Pseudoclavibacter sp. Z016 TaxID=2080581 RepID=UPI000CE80E3C|nr:hypothetical protein [Pseudoclavibacter sp. Z016]PPF72590.1 hypothetical protein C5B99_17265 [Pseudoclavibacter sp. Z016]